MLLIVMLPIAFVVMLVTYPYAEVMCSVSTRKGFRIGVLIGVAVLVLEILLATLIYSRDEYDGAIRMMHEAMFLSFLIVPEGVVLLGDVQIRKSSHLSEEEKTFPTMALFLSLMVYVVFGVFPLPFGAAVLPILGVTDCVLAFYLLRKEVVQDEQR